MHFMLNTEMRLRGVEIQWVHVELRALTQARRGCCADCYVSMFLRGVDNISTRKAIVESRWDSEKYTNDSFLGKRQHGEGPRISILMDINNL